MSQRAFRRYPAIAAALCAALLLASAASVNAQSKAIKRNAIYRDAPVEVAELRVKDQTVAFDEAFEAGPEWLKDVSLKIRNSSETNIVCIWVKVVFHETTPHPSQHLIIVGQPTNTASIRDRRPLELKPGEVLRLSLADEYKELKTLVEHSMAVESVSRLNLEVDRAYFDDGTMWDMGGTYRPDPERPGKWILVRQGVVLPPR